MNNEIVEFIVSENKDGFKIEVSKSLYNIFITDTEGNAYGIIPSEIIKVIKDKKVKTYF